MPAHTVEGDKFDQVDLDHLTPEQREQVKTVFRKHSKVFDNKPGCCNVVEHQIKLVEGFQPKSLKVYRIPDKLKTEINRQIDELLKDGKIRPSNSPFAHPIVCVAKKGNAMDIRLCCDFRYVNSGTITDAYPMPRIDDLLRKISNSKFISTLDATAGYWQLKMSPDDIYKTAFITDRGLFEWLVMPFGLKCSGNTFMRAANIILRPHTEYAGAYIDDTAVCSLEWEYHLTHLDNVLTSFENAGMTLKLTKCTFGKPFVEFVGHLVGSGTMSVIQSKVEAIRLLPEPTTKKLLRSFLGMCGWYKTYIPRYSEIALTLTDMTKTKMPATFVFDANQRRAFQALKESLCNSRTLATPKYDREFHIYCDASELAVGCCLAQVDDKGEERPIAFASKKLTDTETRWACIEREAFSVIFALQKFDVIIFGSKIILFTDHNPLKFLVNGAPKSAKLTRWSLSLQRYDIEVKHIAGVDNKVAAFANCSQIEKNDIIVSTVLRTLETDSLRGFSLL